MRLLLCRAGFAIPRSLYYSDLQSEMLVYIVLPLAKDFENLRDFATKHFENLRDFVQKDFEEMDFLRNFAVENHFQ